MNREAIADFEPARSQQYKEKKHRCVELGVNRPEMLIISCPECNSRFRPQMVVSHHTKHDLQSFGELRTKSWQPHWNGFPKSEGIRMVPIVQGLDFAGIFEKSQAQHDEYNEYRRKGGWIEPNSTPQNG